MAVCARRTKSGRIASNRHRKGSLLLIGTCRITLHIPHSQSLKQKRGTVKSVLARLHNEFNVSAAEIDTHDAWQVATLGIAYVSTSAAHADEVIAKAVRFVERHAVDAVLTDYETEIVMAR